MLGVLCEFKIQYGEIYRQSKKKSKFLLDYLKSSMERFIVSLNDELIQCRANLKSSMERFIENERNRKDIV